MPRLSSARAAAGTSARSRSTTASCAPWANATWRGVPPDRSRRRAASAWGDRGRGCAREGGCGASRATRRAATAILAATATSRGERAGRRPGGEGYRALAALGSAAKRGLVRSMCSGVSPSEFCMVHALDGAAWAISRKTARHWSVRLSASSSISSTLLWSWSSSSTFFESCLGGYSKLAQHKCRGVFPSPSRMLCNTPISLESLGINRIISTAKAGGAFQAATWRTVPPSRGCGRESWAAISSRWACARRWARWARREGQRAFWRVWWRGEMRRSASRSSSLSSSLSSLWSLSSLSSLWSLSSLSGWEKVDGGRELR
mmetsp:Transcript_6689/g.13871  ORF Transcript_6689/g.13871 Transcript_6689/m.13871 type:complete len:318 (+) Transcript_6689:51-1004(+)